MGALVLLERSLPVRRPGRGRSAPRTGSSPQLEEAWRGYLQDDQGQALRTLPVSPAQERGLWQREPWPTGAVACLGWRLCELPRLLCLHQLHIGAQLL